MKLVILLLVLSAISSPQQLASLGSAQDVGKTGLEVVPRNDLAVFSNVTVHQGPLIISQDLLIVNALYVQTGDVVVKRGKLTLRSAELRMEQSHYGQYNITVKNDAIFNIESGQLTSQFWFPLYFLDNSRGTLADCFMTSTTLFPKTWSKVIVDGCQLQALSNWDNAKTNIYRSTILTSASINILDKNTQGSIDGLNPGFISYWNLYTNGSMIVLDPNNPFAGTMGDVTLFNTWLQEWTIAINTRAKVTIANSDIANLILYIEGTSTTLADLRPGLIGRRGFGTVTFTNTMISKQWSISPTQATVNLSNSQVRIGPYFKGSSTLNIATTDVEAMEFTSGSGTITLSSCNVAGSLITADSNIRISGDSSWGSINILQWTSSTITRTYKVKVRDDSGHPASGVQVRLETAGGQLIGSFYTDAAGEALIPVSFTDSNYSLSYNIRTVPSSMNGTVILTLASTSPIILLLDATPPTARFATPSNDSNLQDIITVEVIATDNQRVEHVEFYIDSALYANLTDPPYTALLDTTQYPDGEHTLRARAVDSAGNTAEDSILVHIVNHPAATTTSTSLPPQTSTTTQTTISTTTHPTTTTRPVPLPGTVLACITAAAASAVSAVKSRPRKGLKTGMKAD